MSTQNGTEVTAHSKFGGSGLNGSQVKQFNSVRIGKKLSVLLAADSVIDQTLVSIAVRGEGHSIQCVCNGHLAIESASRRHFDVILMNERMPDMDGLAATRAIRSGDSPCINVPIIVLTADASSEQHEACIEAGITELLSKPIDLVVLAERLTSIATGTLAHVKARVDDEISNILLLDDVHLHELEATIGKQHITTLLTMLVAELRKTPNVITLAKNAGNIMLLASEAHTLKGVASNMGASRVAAAARRIENVTLSELTDRLVRELDAAAIATITAIEAWLTQSRLK